VNPFEQMEDAPRGEVPIRRVLVPLDGSEESLTALKLAQAVGRLYEAELILLHSPPVLHRPGAYPELPPRPEAVSAEERAHRLLAPIRERLEAAGQPARLRAGKLPPALEILQAIEDEDADLIVMTTHGRGGLSRWVFGSVAEKVLRNCRIPMLVMRAPVPEEERTKEVEKAWVHG
jgi:nucleotide-binding universal stress UspA family protein